MARPWQPSSYTHCDRERWICVYPAYINSKKTKEQGRRIPKAKGIENPTYAEIRDVVAAAGFTLGVENKVYPRELDPRDQKAKGRIRVQIKNEDGTPVNEEFPTRQSLLLYCGEMIPKLKTRQGSGAAQPSSQSQTGGSSGKKRKGGKRK